MTAIAIGGLAVSYLIFDDEPLMWRLAAGNVIGSVIFATTGFALAFVLGLNTPTVIAAFVLTLFPVALLLRGPRRKNFAHDWAKAKGKLQGGSSAKFLRFAYYAFFLLVFVLFFDRAMMETPSGIFTGGSQNLGDLPFHLGAIYSFTDGANFPPQNPSFAGAKFSYPFLADLLTAFYVKLGADVRNAMFVQNVGWAFSLLAILERFVFRLSNDRLAARIAPFLLFFSGGLGFLWFFSDYWSQTKGFFDFLSNLPKDYTISDAFRWGNSMVVLFMTQRSLLLGMPLTLIVLDYLWKVFATEPTDVEVSEKSHEREKAKKGKSEKVVSPLLSFSFSPFLVGVLAGTLPLVHLHSLAVLFVVGLCLFIAKPEKWKTWLIFAAGVAVIAVPEILWSMAGSATRTAEFFAWHYGWDKRDQNFFWFWFTNTGIFIPLLVFGLYRAWIATGDQESKEKGQRTKDEGLLSTHHSSLLAFYIPFAIVFVVSNAAKLAPWEWDNIKLLIYWWVGSIPFAALAIAWIWRKGKAYIAVAAACIFIMTASGALDVWRTVSGQINTKVFDKDAVEIGKRVRPQPEKDAVILNAPTYNTAAVLTGRISVMRYPGHLSSHGIDYAARETDVKRIYGGGSIAASLMEKYNVSYVLISPEERGTMAVNEDFFRKFPVLAEVGQYKVYKIK